jgi:hypothetical protein
LINPVSSIQPPVTELQAHAILRPMSSLAEIEVAADSLSSEEKEELLRFLTIRLRKERLQTAPRIYSDEELAAMLAEDEADGERFVVLR